MRRSAGLSILPYLFFAIVPLVFADIPRLIDFQGLLTDSRGRPINGQHDLVFAIYDVPTNGASLWTETHLNVGLDRGAFSVQLGSSNSLFPAFDTSYWVGISVDGGTELLPRLRLTSAPYAFRAAVADALSSNAVSNITSNIIASLPPPSAILRGVIVMWWGNIASIPTNEWALCDGSRGTPDLRDRFVVGARADSGGVAASNLEGMLKQSGGSTDQPPRTSEQGANERHAPGNNSSSGAHYHHFVPPYYALAFIMKL